MKNRTLVTVVFTLLSSALAATEASAQQASSFDELHLLVKPGDEIIVMEPGGAAAKGRIDELSSSSLRLRMKGSVRDLAEADVLEIRQRRDDSLRNGARNGAWIGLGLGVLGSIAACQGIINRSGCAVAAFPIVGFYVGISAAIGVGIDALITRPQTIYRNPARGVSLSWSF